MSKPTLGSLRAAQGKANIAQPTWPSPDLRIRVSTGGGRVLDCTAFTEAGRTWLAQVAPFPPRGYSYHDLLVQAGGLASFGPLILEITHEHETAHAIPAA